MAEAIGFFPPEMEIRGLTSLEKSNNRRKSLSLRFYH
jgi:hypothetical protein